MVKSFLAAAGRLAYKMTSFQIAAACMSVALLAGCAAQPSVIVADDDALCRYSEVTDGGQPYDACRKKLDAQKARISLASATRIDGYALLQGPAQPDDVAGSCATGVKDCPADDVTGTIPRAPKR